MKRMNLVSVAILLGLPALQSVTGDKPDRPSFEQYLKESAVSREVIDRFLQGPSWAQFDPELGYILGNYLPSDGMDKSATLSTVQSNGARTSFVYAGRKCRINTYGDSFTQCHQVSDGETWQEYLAGHLGEPIRNFGMGGYGVYQAFRRMVREERTDHGAEYLIFYIWGDDHIRSLLRCRHAIIFRWWDHQGGRMFHNNFWPNLELDLQTGRFVEKENLLPTRASLYQMTDPQWMVEHLKDDLALQLVAFKQGLIRDLDRKPIDALATRLDFSMDWNRESALPSQAGELLDRYSLRATLFVLEKAREFARQNRKKLLVVLFDPYRAMAEMRRSGIRYDRAIVDYLAREKFDYFDMNEVQLRDFKKFNLPYEEYLKQYFIGHYSPRGNHFFAYSIKDTVVEWLNPKPITYRTPDPQSIDFKGYLPDSRSMTLVGAAPLNPRAAAPGPTTVPTNQGRASATPAGRAELAKWDDAATHRPQAGPGGTAWDSHYRSFIQTDESAVLKGFPTHAEAAKQILADAAKGPENLRQHKGWVLFIKHFSQTYRPESATADLKRLYEDLVDLKLGGAPGDSSLPFEGDARLTVSFSRPAASCFGFIPDQRRLGPDRIRSASLARAFS